MKAKRSKEEGGALAHNAARMSKSSLFVRERLLYRLLVVVYLKNLLTTPEGDTPKKKKKKQRKDTEARFWSRTVTLFVTVVRSRLP